jgi:hypothetical protein
MIRAQQNGRLIGGPLCHAKEIQRNLKRARVRTNQTERTLPSLQGRASTAKNSDKPWQH